MLPCSLSPVRWDNRQVRPNLNRRPNRRCASKKSQTRPGPVISIGSRGFLTGKKPGGYPEEIKKQLYSWRLSGARTSYVLDGRTVSKKHRGVKVSESLPDHEIEISMRRHGCREMTMIRSRSPDRTIRKPLGVPFDSGVITNDFLVTLDETCEDLS